MGDHYLPYIVGRELRLSLYSTVCTFTGVLGLSTRMLCDACYSVCYSASASVVKVRATPNDAEGGALVRRIFNFPVYFG